MCKRFGNFLVKIKAILSKSKTYLQLRKFKDLLQAYMASSPVVFLPQEFQLAIKGDTSSHNMVWRGFYNMSWIWISNSSQSLVNTPNNWHGFSLHDFSPANKKIVGKLRKKTLWNTTTFSLFVVLCLKKNVRELQNRVKWTVFFNHGVFWKDSLWFCSGSLKNFQSKKIKQSVWNNFRYKCDEVVLLIWTLM